MLQMRFRLHSFRSEMIGCCCVGVLVILRSSSRAPYVKLCFACVLLAVVGRRTVSCKHSVRRCYFVSLAFAWCETNSSRELGRVLAGRVSWHRELVQPLSLLVLPHLAHIMVVVYRVHFCFWYDTFPCRSAFLQYENRAVFVGPYCWRD